MLGGQANVPDVAGTWKDLTDSVNFMASNLTGQVRNIADVTTAVARGDLTQKITVDVRGEVLELKQALRDLEDRFVQGGLKRIRADLDNLAAIHEEKANRAVQPAEQRRGTALTQDQKEAARRTLRPTYTPARVDEAFARVQGATDLQALQGVDLVVEAVVEDPKVKNDLFAQLDGICGSRTVFCTNTSALPITPMAAASGRPGRFLGTHFFNPPTTLPLVEIIRGAQTDEETVQDVMNVLSSMRNHRYPLLPIPVKECPGFLVNRVLGAMLEEAYRCLEEGVASARDIDAAMKAGAGFPMGPLELSDMVGLDVIHHVMKNSHELAKAYPRIETPTVVAKLVAEGRLGRKTGKGFFDY